MGLLAGVLITVAGLLLMGGQQLDRGRQRSAALAVARDVLEEVQGWSFDQTTSRFDEPCTADAPCTFAGQSVAAEWQRRLDETLPGASAGGEIVVEPLDEAGALVAADAASLVRLRVRVFWSEGPLERDVRLVSVRM